MTADSSAAGARFALLHNGSRFSSQVLSTLLEQGHAPELLVLPGFPPADPAQSSLIEVASAPPLSKLASDIEVSYAPRTRQAQFAEYLQQRQFDFLLVACWPYLIDAMVVAGARHLALNLHPSMLPAYPGPDPIGDQLAAGETHLGVSLHRLSPQFDQGEILLQARLPDSLALPDRDAIETACAQLGGRLFIETLREYAAQFHPKARYEPVSERDTKR